MSAKKLNIEENVMEIAERQMSVNRELITHETTFINDLGTDSLDLAELHMELEAAFDLDIPNGDTEKILTFGNAIDYIKERAQR
jgi:acyl carrier protein